MTLTGHVSSCVLVLSLCKLHLHSRKWRCACLGLFLPYQLPFLSRIFLLSRLWHTPFHLSRIRHLASFLHKLLCCVYRPLVSPRPRRLSSPSQAHCSTVSATGANTNLSRESFGYLNEVSVACAPLFPCYYVPVSVKKTCHVEVYSADFRGRGVRNVVCTHWQNVREVMQMAWLLYDLWRKK